MTKYHTGLNHLIIDEFLPLKPKDATIRRQEIIDWVNETYPGFSSTTITNWLTRMITNAPGRLNWPTGIKELDIFYKLQNGMLRLYNPNTDPRPIYHYQEATENEELYEDIKTIHDDSSLSSTEKECLINSRIGQGEFRQNVIECWGLGETCAITFVGIREVLIASHIRPWRNCQNRAERLDGANGILLCAHLDKLFDHHLISFKLKNGKYICQFNNSLNKNHLKHIGIVEGIQLNTKSLNDHDLKRFNYYIDEHYKIFSEKNSIAN